MSTTLESLIESPAFQEAVQLNVRAEVERVLHKALAESPSETALAVLMNAHIRDFGEFQHEMRDFKKTTETHFNRIDNRLDNIDNRLDNIDNRLDNIDNRLDNIETRLDKTVTNDGLKRVLDEHTNRILEAIRK